MVVNQNPNSFLRNSKFKGAVIDVPKSNSKSHFTMKKTLLFFTVAFGFAFANAQCATTIFPQPGHIPVTTDQSLNATGTVYWICSGLTVTILSSEGDVYLCESNVTLNIVGSAGDQVFAKSGCVIHNESSADIGVSCYPSDVTFNNTGAGTLTIDAVCDQVIYDYSLIGGSGTCASTGIEENRLTDVSVYPNPFISALEIAGMKTEGEATLYTMLGNEVQRWKITAGENIIETNRVIAGVYFLKVKTADGIVTMKVIKQ